MVHCRVTAPAQLGATETTTTHGAQAFFLSNIWHQRAAAMRGNHLEGDEKLSVKEEARGGLEERSRSILVHSGSKRHKQCPFN